MRFHCNACPFATEDESRAEEHVMLGQEETGTPWSHAVWEYVSDMKGRATKTGRHFFNREGMVFESKRKGKGNG